MRKRLTLIKKTAFIQLFILVLVCMNIMELRAQEPAPSPPGQQPSLSGNWTYSIQSNEITEAGTDFSGTYTSASNQLIYNRNATDRYSPDWSVTVYKSDIVWNSNIKLWIRRTGNGTGVNGSSISGGANYIEILNTSSVFFSGYKEINEVPLQLELTGLSAIIPADVYSTILTFTITAY